ncbi:YjzD family protein [Lactobacillaceae bacterium L1_55_11]|nr:YjzD family protein [Lactobacillaceae bacterium L1_55_11]
MKYVTVAFWSAIFGEILGYLVSQLNNVTYNYTAVAVVAIIVGEIAIIAIPGLSGKATKDAVDTKQSNQ